MFHFFPVVSLPVCVENSYPFAALVFRASPYAFLVSPRALPLVRCWGPQILWMRNREQSEATCAQMQVMHVAMPCASAAAAALRFHVFIPSFLGFSRPRLPLDTYVCAVPCLLVGFLLAVLFGLTGSATFILLHKATDPPHPHHRRFASLLTILVLEVNHTRVPHHLAFFFFMTRVWYSLASVGCSFLW